MKIEAGKWPSELIGEVFCDGVRIEKVIDLDIGRMKASAYQVDAAGRLVFPDGDRLHPNIEIHRGKITFRWRADTCYEPAKLEADGYAELLDPANIEPCAAETDGFCEQNTVALIPGQAIGREEERWVDLAGHEHSADEIVITAPPYRGEWLWWGQGLGEPPTARIIELGGPIPPRMAWIDYRSNTEWEWRDGAWAELSQTPSEPVHGAMRLTDRGNTQVYHSGRWWPDEDDYRPAPRTLMGETPSEAIDYLGLINPDTGELGNCRCDPNIVMEPRPEPDTLFRASAGDTLYSLGDGNLCVSITATRDLMFGMSDADEAALKEVVARLAKRGGAL